MMLMTRSRFVCTPLHLISYTTTRQRRIDAESRRALLLLSLRVPRAAACAVLCCVLGARRALGFPPCCCAGSLHFVL
jgi:hypothetical protein